MTEQDSDNFEDMPEAEVSMKGSGISMIWLTPLIAALIGGWLVFQSFSGQGPTIHVSFKSASGIEAGKTQIKYKDIPVGTVEDVQFSDDLSQVDVTIEMNQKMESRLTDSTRFWVVRPRIGASGVSGLSTLLSGAYIAMDPDESGADAKEFTGLEEPPGFATDSPGTLYHLRAETLGGMSIDSPVYHRQIQVGKVVKYAFADKGRYVDIDVFIDAPHDLYVSSNSRFWNVSGLDVDLSAQGVKIGVESLISLVAGGISFTTPEGVKSRTKAPEGTLFTLFEDKKQSREEIATLTVPILLYFEDTVRGLSVDAPVEFRGIRVGTVKSIEFESDGTHKKLRIPVLIALEPDRIPGNKGELRHESEEVRNASINEMLGKLVAGGMRARLETGNLITGQLFVNLDMFPGEQSAVLTHKEGYPVLPTLPGTISGLTRKLDRILGKLEEAPIGEIGLHLKNTLAGTDALVNDKGLLLASVNNINKSLQQIEELAGNINKGPINTQVLRTLEELEATARSLRIMAEYLERHPEALIKGKQGTP